MENGIWPIDQKGGFLLVQHKDAGIAVSIGHIDQLQGLQDITSLCLPTRPANTKIAERETRKADQHLRLASTAAGDLALHYQRIAEESRQKATDAQHDRSKLPDHLLVNQSGVLLLGFRGIEEENLAGAN